MKESVWIRHANPWSVWTRVVTGLPVSLGAIWSFRLVGWWGLAWLSIAILWLWLNPRIFPVPQHTNNWASKVTFGERVWLNRRVTPIPKHHSIWAMFLSVSGGSGFVVAVIGASYNDLYITLIGGVVSWFSKMWFCDRMVWLYNDMQQTSSVKRTGKESG
jgi:hypothetical protein